MPTAHSPQDLHAIVLDAFNRQDVDSLVSLYEPDAVFVSAGGPVEGREAIAGAYRAAVASRPGMELQTLGIHVCGDLAMLRGTWTVIDGESRRSGRNTEVARRQSDGRWLFVIDNPYA